MKPTASIIISSHNRLGLFRRVLWGIANRPPSVPFEVVVVDDGSAEDVLGELNLYGARFEWTFVRFESADFEAKTGLKKFLGNPAVTNNVAFKHARGELIFQQGNEVIPWGDCYDRLAFDAPVNLAEFRGKREHWLVVSTTYDVPRQVVDQMDSYGSNLTEWQVGQLRRWPLQDRHYRSDVTNYISLAPRALWEVLGGYDERYYGGISAEDSDFVRRARKLPGFEMVVSEGVSLHQYHRGKTCYYDPPPSVISKERWNEGVALNHAIYHAWDPNGPDAHKNPQKWPRGEYGVGEVVTNWK